MPDGPLGYLAAQSYNGGLHDNRSTHQRSTRACQITGSSCLKQINNTTDMPLNTYIKHRSKLASGQTMSEAI